MGIELPEAITLARQMHRELAGKEIRKAIVTKDCGYLIRQGFMNLSCAEFAAALTGSEIIAVAARGKWIFIKLRDNCYLLLAPEMGGRILYHDSAADLPERYHLKLDFETDDYLTVRIYGGGFLKVLPAHALTSDRYPGLLGVSPLDPERFTPQYFHDALRVDRRAVKAALLDQTRIAGLGNGYLQDILYIVGIHPMRKAADISPEQEVALYAALKETMARAVRKGGSEFELDLYNRPGSYERVIGRHLLGMPCPRCGEPIVRMTILGSPAYLCPCCQK